MLLPLAIKAYSRLVVFFFFNDTATTEIYTLSLHDALPISIALEMLEEAPDLDVLVIPIGGGGLISGIAIAAKAVKPGIEIVGVESALYPSFWNAIHNAQRPFGGATLAEGIAVENVGTLTLPIVR